MKMKRSQLIKTLTNIAPLELAGSWDNVGLLLDPCARDPEVKRILLTIDLNAQVLDEAISKDIDGIIAYHPILFAGTKRLLWSDVSSRIILEACQRSIWIYSPHTALDAAEDGMTDWLLSTVGEMQNAHVIDPHPVISNAGAGRVGTLTTNTPLSTILRRLSEKLGLKNLRVSTALQKPVDEIEVNRVAVCPGAGGSVVAAAKGHDLVVTGEMSHHAVLANQVRGITTILTEHSNCERGFLPEFAARISKQHPTLHLTCASTDADPLSTWRADA